MEPTIRGYDRRILHCIVAGDSVAKINYFVRGYFMESDPESIPQLSGRSQL